MIERSVQAYQLVVSDDRISSEPQQTIYLSLFFILSHLPYLAMFRILYLVKLYGAYRIFVNSVEIKIGYITSVIQPCEQLIEEILLIK